MNSEQVLYDTAKAFGEAFETAQCFFYDFLKHLGHYDTENDRIFWENEIYDEFWGDYHTIPYWDNEVYQLDADKVSLVATQLQEICTKFQAQLYTVIAPFKDDGARLNVYYEIVKRHIDNESMFSTYYDFEFFVKNAPKKQTGIAFIQLIDALRASTSWHTGFPINMFHTAEEDDCDFLYHRRSLPPSSTVHLTNSVQCNTPLIHTKKVSREVRIALLAQLIERTGIASTAKRTDIAAFIECVTGGNPNAESKGCYSIRCMNNDVPREYQHLLDSIVPPRRK